MFLLFLDDPGQGCSSRPRRASPELGSIPADDAKLKNFGGAGSTRRTAPASQQLHPHHPEFHHELSPHCQGRSPRQASGHRPPPRSQGLRRRRLGQDQALPSSPAPGTHRFHLRTPCPSVAVNCAPIAPLEMADEANEWPRSPSSSRRKCTSPASPNRTRTALENKY